MESMRESEEAGGARCFDEVHCHDVPPLIVSDYEWIHDACEIHKCFHSLLQYPIW